MHSVTNNQSALKFSQNVERNAQKFSDETE